MTAMTPRAASRYVTDHLAKAGFTGDTEIESTRTPGGNVTTEIRRGPGAVPWTQPLQAWIRRTVLDLPGFVQYDARPQTVYVTWRAER